MWYDASDNNHLHKHTAHRERNRETHTRIVHTPVVSINGFFHYCQ